MTPDEKRSELKRHRDILLATIDYFTEQSAGVGDFNQSARFERLKEKTEEHYRKGSLTSLKHWLRDITEVPREISDLRYSRYIREKTGYDIDIFEKFQKRIGKITKRKRIKTEYEYRDVLAMVDHLCQLTPADQNKIAALNHLLIDFDDRISRPKTAESKRKLTGHNNFFLNQLTEVPSPDNKRKLLMTESGPDEKHATTQVLIQFERSGTGVYAADGINLGIKTYWKDNNRIVVETRKSHVVLQKREQVQSFQDVVIVEYVEN